MEDVVFLPLVSVAVITYNSSKTIVETLDSIAAQTYPNLELIISDDCSTDNTIDICREWIEGHKDRFARTELLTVDKNTGVSANMNRGADACQGEWVKDIAGDDVLLPDCIEIYVDFVKDHIDAVYVFAGAELFGGDDEKRKEWEDYYSSVGKSFFEWPIEKQYDYLTFERNPTPAATTFYNREKIMEYDVRNDERIPFYEDKPKWINLLKKGVRFDYIDRSTVRYRLSDSSLCRHTPEKFQKSQAKFYLLYCFHNDFKKRSKKRAILQWMRSQRSIHDKTVFWRIICILYKTIFGLQ